jgi:predicted O-methyltransferase YrrM
MNLEDIKNLAALSQAMTTVNDEYADSRCKWVVDPANKGKDMWWGKEQPYYRFLYLITKNLHGGMAIEVGTHKGIGFSCLAAGSQASHNPKSWTVGIDKDGHAEAREVSTKYKNTVFINGLSNAPSTLKQIEEICEKEQIKINVMFIDATHKICLVNEELKTYRHLFSDNVVLIFDDIIRADNNTKLPECFDALPGQKVKFPGLHTDNCIAVSLSSFEEFKKWVPPAPTDLGY